MTKSAAKDPLKAPSVKPRLSGDEEKYKQIKTKYSDREEIEIDIGNDKKVNYTIFNPNEPDEIKSE